jgi:hypothetical protein
MEQSPAIFLIIKIGRSRGAFGVKFLCHIISMCIRNTFTLIPLPNTFTRTILVLARAMLLNTTLIHAGNHT